LTEIHYFDISFRNKPRINIKNNVVQNQKDKMNNPYKHSDPPKMLPSFVCYADILGYSYLSRKAIKSGNGLQFLHRLRHALSNAYERIREHSKGLRDDSFYAVKVFTDNIVVGYPLNRPSFDYGEPEFGDILSTFSEFQVGLAMEGFFLRGGIAFGEHYMDDDIVFGDALLEAVDEDKGGGPPRISLAPSAIELVRRHLGFYRERSEAPQHEDLLEDADGTIFLNYLGEAFYAFPDGGIFFELIEGHRQNIVSGLKDYKGNPGVRAKFEWAARYHNFICQEFAEGHPIPTNPDVDEIYAAATEEAQKLLDYRIDIESLAARPCRINLTPIKLRRHE
jgi:hypothetical protein